jgi:hypothetical protein
LIPYFFNDFFYCCLDFRDKLNFYSHPRKKQFILPGFRDFSF